MPLWPRRTCRCWLVYKVTISLGSLLELDFGTLPELNAVGGWCLIAFRLESWGYSDKTAKRYTAYNLGQNGPMYRCPDEGEFGSRIVYLPMRSWILRMAACAARRTRASTCTSRASASRMGAASSARPSLPSASAARSRTLASLRSS